MLEVESKSPYILTVKNVLSADECREMIERIDALGPKIATVNTPGGTRVRTDVRNNERVMFDDPDLATRLVKRVKKFAPETIAGMTLVGANERFRCYRYQPGMRFAPHADGAYFRNDREFSCYTFMVYLNADFEGGHTTFFTQPEVSIKPETGMALIFQHPIIHEGAVVTAGVKYVMRSDLMYREP